MSYFRAKQADGTIVKVPVGRNGRTPVKGIDYFTEDDIALIVARVIQSLGGEPIFGYVDEDNNIIVQGNLGDGTYSVKYEMADGSTVSIGNLVLDNNVYYSVTKNLTNCVVSNGATKVVEGSSYSATITANSGYELSSVSVTMGGSAVSVSGGVINIASVTGDIVITAVATETVVEIVNLAVPNDLTGDEAQWNTGEWCNNSYMAGSSYAYRSSTDARVTTNLFTVEYGDVIYVKGINYAADSTCQIATFDSDKNRIMHKKAADMDSNGYISGLTSDSADYWYFTNTNSQGEDTGCRYIRLAGHLSGTNADVIITRNQPIV